jgi:hypothetical protein
MKITLADLHAAAVRVAATAEAAALTAEQAKAAGVSDWQAAHIASQKARTARAVAEAIAEVSAEF